LACTVSITTNKLTVVVNCDTTDLCRVHTLSLEKNPGLSRTPVRNFPGPFSVPRMVKDKKKTPGHLLLTTLGV